MDESQRDSDLKQEEITQLKIHSNKLQMELETEKTHSELERKRFAFQEAEEGLAVCNYT